MCVCVCVCVCLCVCVFGQHFFLNTYLIKPIIYYNKSKTSNLVIDNYFSFLIGVLQKKKEKLYISI